MSTFQIFEKGDCIPLKHFFSSLSASSSFILFVILFIDPFFFFLLCLSLSTVDALLKRILSVVVLVRLMNLVEWKYHFQCLEISLDTYPMLEISFQYHFEY